ncbi:hypothetical protein DZC30_15350 [Comamonas testosteroni]|uniref:Uncharacterized protein n=1 Tax=Comamonas testosteroni TaxID=285 RepID=A0A373FGU4_COMTE|nr:hypothetical protein DZC30_15350 [Comamonas testosteroni]
MVNLASPKDTLALGLAIVAELRLDTRGELLQRWMAHHLAETIQAAKLATGTKKTKLERDAVNLVLKLWAHRSALPEPIDPLSGCREAVEMLKRLQPEANPWAYFSRRQPDETHLREMFNAMSKAVLAGIALTQLKQSKEPSAEAMAHLDPIELALLDAFKEWQPFVDRTPHNKVSWKTQDDGGAALSFTTEPKHIEAVYADPKDEIQLQDLVGENMKALHLSLGKLIDQWESHRKSDSIQPS